MNQNAATRNQTEASRSTDGSLIASDRVEGTKVLDLSGKHIGTIKGLKIDKVSGQAAYAVAEFGGFLGMGGHDYTIPWRKLNYDPGRHGFSTDLTKEQLEGAPSSSRRSSTYRASAGGVGTGRRPDTDTTMLDTSPDSDDDDWDRNRERELYDYYVVGYYWEQ